MKKYLIIKQDGLKDCGAASLLSIIRYYKGNISINKLIEMTNTDKTGTSFYFLKEAAEKIGLETIGYKIDDISTLTNIKKPFICQFINQNYEHFVVIYSIKKNKVVIMDPAYGKRTINIEDFKKIWTGYILTFSPKKKLLFYQNKKYLNKIIFKTLLNNKYIVISILIKSCTVCGQQISKTTLYRVKTVKLEKAMFVYNGKNPAVSVTVKDSKGKKLKKNTDYKVKLASLGKKVGTYKVTVTFTGNYTGEKVLSFEVVPKGTSISKLTSSKKGFTVKWKKQTKETAGYELQYSTSKKFTKKTTKTLTAKSKSTSKKVQKLKAKKTYYVRIRTYKTVKGKKLYSAWSSVKSVKTK